MTLKCNTCNQISNEPSGVKRPTKAKDLKHYNNWLKSHRGHDIEFVELNLSKTGGNDEIS